MEKTLSTLQGTTNAATVRKELADLQNTISTLPTNAAISAIRQALDSKKDASTHTGFTITGGGFLNEAPTMRTFLLDQLGRIDPAAAAEYSKRVLGSMDSSDEWAVALRNLARGDQSQPGRQLLAEKIGAMLHHEPWQQNPSVGYLEAFDVAVYLGGTSLLPTLSDLVRRADNPAVAHAAFLALDRLVINSPAETLAALQADPGLMQGRESTRADYFARADVRDPQQKQVLENYLLDARRSAAELETFVGIFPNANFMISPNLLTPTPTLDHAALTARDAASLQAAQEWLDDPRFVRLRPELQKTISRLQEFVRQAKAGQ